MSQEPEIIIEEEVISTPVEENSDNLSPEERFAKGITDEVSLDDSLQARLKMYASTFDAMAGHVTSLKLMKESVSPEEAVKIDDQIKQFEYQQRLFACLKDGSYDLLTILKENTKFNEDDFKYPQRYSVLFNNLIEKLVKDKKTQYAHPNFLIASLVFCFPGEEEFQRKVLHRIFDGLLKSKDSLLIGSILSFGYYFQRNIAKQQMREQLPEEEQKLITYAEMKEAFEQGVLNAFSSYR